MSEVATALRSYLVDWGKVAQRIYRDTAPAYDQYPQITFIDPVTVVPAMGGDGRTTYFERTIQVDLWQRRLVNGVPAEDLVLASDLMDWLDGAKLPLMAGEATAMRVQQMQRLPDPDLDIVRHTVTITLRQVQMVA